MKSVTVSCRTPSQRAQAIRELREKFAADGIAATAKPVGAFKIEVRAEDDVFDKYFGGEG